MLFFQGCRALPLVLPADPDTPVQGQGHDHFIEAFRLFKVTFGPLEAARFKVGEHRFNTPAQTVVKNARPRRGAIHGDDPGFWVAGFMQNADCSRYAFRKQRDLGQGAFTAPFGQFTRGGQSVRSDRYPRKNGS